MPTPIGVEQGSDPIRLVDSKDCVIHGCTVQDESEEGQATGASLVEIENCRRISISGGQFLDGVPFGIDVKESSYVNIGGCSVLDTREKKKAKGSIRFTGEGEANVLSNLSIEGRDSLKLAPESGVQGAVI